VGHGYNVTRLVNDPGHSARGSFISERLGIPDNTARQTDIKLRMYIKTFLDQELISYIAINLVLLVVVGPYGLSSFILQPDPESLRLRRFQSDRDEIWQDCSSGKYASIDGVRFSI